ncbi:MAG TPA: aminotransferase class V-fold PLP-dependent enzyme [Bryobacteraceae bacterium]|nr:aminotransferase class V-fold PLP-dependent enzyme [Bryobacteraceae bacterium]
MDRRSFLSSAVTLGAFQVNSVARAQSAAASVSGRPAEVVARDEDFWTNIRRAFTVDRNIINLNNGGVSPSPKVVMDTEVRYLEIENMTPTYYMWRILDPGIERVRRRLAGTFGCDPEEIAITRNASEALEIVQFGLDLKAGDEVITTNQDYPRMIASWQQRERRDGIVLKQLKFPVPPPSMQYLVKLIEDSITPKTRVIHICHMTNRTGQIFPVKEICRLGRARGIEVIVDGAHAFAQFPFKQADLDCDYYGTSLHKWLLAPIGTGMLYVRKSKIPKIWPMMGAEESLHADIRKFEQIGTHPASQRNAITEAIDFHDSIGAERKAERFRYLRLRWANRLRGLPGVKILNSEDPAQSCAIGFLSVDKFDAVKLTAHLWAQHRIWTTAIVTPGEFEGLRITPNVYTTLEEIDTFAEAMEGLIKRGSIPA